MSQFCKLWHIDHKLLMRIALFSPKCSKIWLKQPFFNHLCLFFLACSLIWSPASAQMKYYGATESSQRSGEGQRQESLIRIRQSDCRWLERHEPDSNVTYQAGVTLDGREVAPADMQNSSVFGPADDLTFVISVRLDDRFKTNADPRPDIATLGEAPVGVVRIKDGVVYFNGQPFDASQTAAVSRACRRAHDKDSQKD